MAPPSASTVSSVSFDAFNTELQANALKATRNALALPSDVAFHRSMDSDFSKDLDALSSRVLSLTNNLLALISTSDATGKAKAKKIEGQDDLVDNFQHLVVDSMDHLFEGTDMCLDEFLGRSKPPAIAINPPLQKKHTTSKGRIEPVVQHASHLQKPQLSFKQKVVNDDSPWYPTLPHKYNAQVPLGYVFHDSDSEADNVVKNHPYRYEITHITYPDRMFHPSPPIPPTSFDSTPFTWVSTIEDLQSMLAKLRQAPEIAIDLEHHSYRSYAGFVCLMQLSTREEDWVVDTLLLREELSELNEVFTDPKIVKVFHGAESDIVWLQQDFNIYVVNLFDTYHASKILEFPRHGLANLLEMYCDFMPDKRYQLADWRIRPIPQEMLHYARSDTHFLLFIYDNLRNALLDRAQSRAQSRASTPSLPTDVNPLHNLVRQVLARSEETALRTYEKEVYDAEGGSGSNGWDTQARKWNKGFLMASGPETGVGALQRSVFRGVHEWRDKVAKEDDESTRYILPNHYLFQLAEQPPADMATLLKSFSSIPPVIRKRAKELLDVIRDCVARYHAVKPSIAVAVVVEAEEPATKEDVEMVASESASSTLWSNENVVPTTSSLFGTTLAASKFPTRPDLSTTSSALFGSSHTPPVNARVSHFHFRELVTKIHKSLSIVPSAPITLVQEDPPAEEDPQDTDVATGMQIEMPYVHASQRATTEVIADSIVVVGQARQKKRKRPKTISGVAQPTAAAEELVAKDKSEEEDGPDVAFDFEQVPNILDDNPNLDDAGQKRRKKKQKQNRGGTFYGDFPAPPKAHSELKGGNQSHTFK